MNTRTRVTMADVGRLAKVSRNVVSRVVNQSGYVSEEAHKRVMRSMTELGFQSNAVARALRMGQTKTIGLGIYKFDYLMEREYSGFLGGVTHEAAMRGYSLQVLLTVPEDLKDSYEKSTSIGYAAMGGAIDGVIIFDHKMSQQKILELHWKGIPIVLVERSVEVKDTKVPFVSINHRGAIKKVTNYLIEKGHKEIVLISEEMLSSVFHVREKIEGYREAMCEHGLNAAEPLCARQAGLSVEEKAEHAVKVLMERYPDGTGIICTDDVLAVHVVRKLREGGRLVPQDVSIIGYKDDPASVIFQPKLTTVSIPMRQLGEMSARILLDRIEGRQERGVSMVLETDFTERESVLARGSS